ncbi:MAG: hypothetical protein WDA08_11885 [Weeksellaceae bacterium]
MEKIISKIYTDEDGEVTAYIQLPKHPKQIVPGIVKKNISLSEILPNYKGPSIYLDFDDNDELIGIEIIE